MREIASPEFAIVTNQTIQSTVFIRVHEALPQCYGASQLAAHYGLTQGLRGTSSDHSIAGLFPTV